MTPGQTRVLVLLLVLIGIEIAFHPTLLPTIKGAVALPPKQ